MFHVHYHFQWYFFIIIKNSEMTRVFKCIEESSGENIWFYIKKKCYFNIIFNFFERQILKYCKKFN